MNDSVSSLSRADQRFLQTALEVAALGTDGHYRFGSCIVKSGNILGTGTNRHRNYSMWDFLERKDWSVHSEHAAIRAAGKAAQGAVIYVARRRANGDFGASFPCKMCMEHIRAAGIKKIVFFDENGTGTWVRV